MNKTALEMPKKFLNMNYINICNTVKHLSRDKTVNGKSKRHKHPFLDQKITQNINFRTISQ